MLLSNEKPINCTGTVNVQGDASSRSKLIVQTLYGDGELNWVDFSLPKSRTGSEF